MGGEKVEVLFESCYSTSDYVKLSHSNNNDVNDFGHAGFDNVLDILDDEHQCEMNNIHSNNVTARTVLPDVGVVEGGIEEGSLPEADSEDSKDLIGLERKEEQEEGKGKKTQTRKRDEKEEGKEEEKSE